jgi:hypothetical protein
MSFSMTTPAIRARRKTVTRRTGWQFLRPGDLVQAVEKGMGLKKGETVKRLAVLRIVRVSRERLDRLRHAAPADVAAELAAEGVASSCETWQDFLSRYFWPQGCQPDTEVTRIEFTYIDTVSRDGHDVDAATGEVLRRCA